VDIIWKERRRARRQGQVESARHHFPAKNSQPDRQVIGYDNEGVKKNCRALMCLMSRRTPGLYGLWAVGSHFLKKFLEKYPKWGRGNFLAAWEKRDSRFALLQFGFVVGGARLVHRKRRRQARERIRDARPGGQTSCAKQFGTTRKGVASSLLTSLIGPVGFLSTSVRARMVDVRGRRRFICTRVLKLDFHCPV